MTDRTGDHDTDHHDDKATDVDDQFRSLLEGLRTTLPGVQFITAFLLTLPLYDRFDRFSTAEEGAYYVAFIGALLSSLLLMSPSSHQRLRAHDEGLIRRSEHHLRVAIKLTVVGTLAFMIDITAVTFLVSSLVLGTPMAIAMATVVALVGAWSWFYLPLVTFERDDRGGR